MKDIFRKKLHTVELAKGLESLLTVDTGMAVSVTADIEGQRDPHQRQGWRDQVSPRDWGA
jgi:hypothetical protein